MGAMTSFKILEMGEELTKHKREITNIADSLITTLADRRTKIDALITTMQGDADFDASDIQDGQDVLQHLDDEIQRVYTVLTSG